MDLKGAINKIVEIENQVDVNNIKYSGLCVWPLVRLELWTMLCHPEFVENQQSDSLSEITPVNLCTRTFRKAKRLFELRAQLPPLINLRQDYLKELRLFLARHKKSEVIFFDPHITPGGEIKSFHTKHIDSLKEFIDKSYTTTKITMPSRDDKDMPTYYDCETIPLTTYHEELYSLKQNMYADIPIDGFSILYSKVSDITGIALDQTKLINSIYIALTYQSFFERCFERINPAVVFLISYYSPLIMGLISACKKLSIKTVDIQHGKQGKYHGMYTHWTKVPKSGYELLPDYFWMWGDESKSNISRWMPDTSPHKPVVGGNRLLSKWLNKSCEENGSESKDFIESLSQYNRVILFTLQPFQNPVPNNVIEAVKLSPKSWIWLVRLHHSMVDQKKDIIDIFKNLNVEIDKSTQLPLYTLLKHVDYHVTAWSSVCYEALVFRVHTIIIHKTGKYLYDDYIKNNLFSYADKGKDIINITKKDKSEFQYDEKFPYIETDDAIAYDAAKKIYESYKH